MKFSPTAVLLTTNPTRSGHYRIPTKPTLIMLEKVIVWVLHKSVFPLVE
jgi:hypothetical protein